MLTCLVHKNQYNVCNDTTSNPNLNTMHECLPSALTSLTQWAMNPLWWKPHISLTRNQRLSISSQNTPNKKFFFCFFFKPEVVKKFFFFCQDYKGEACTCMCLLDSERALSAHKRGGKPSKRTLSQVFRCPPPPRWIESSWSRTVWPADEHVMVNIYNYLL